MSKVSARPPCQFYAIYKGALKVIFRIENLEAITERTRQVRHAMRTFPNSFVLTSRTKMFYLFLGVKKNSIEWNLKRNQKATVNK
jgi:hypothetical protein